MRISASIDYGEGQHVTFKEVECDTAAPVIALIDEMDGKKSTEVYVQNERGDALIIGGGSYEFFVSFWKDDIGKSWLLGNSIKNTGTLRRTISGGQAADHDTSLLVTRDILNPALKHFVETGERLESLVWRLA